MEEQITIDLPDDVLFQLMLFAHEQDITLNQLINTILREQIDKLGQDDTPTTT